MGCEVEEAGGVLVWGLFRPGNAHVADGDGVADVAVCGLSQLLGVGFAGDSPYDPRLEEACSDEYLDLDGTVVGGYLYGCCGEVPGGECERPATPDGSGGCVAGRGPRYEAPFLPDIRTGGMGVVVLYVQGVGFASLGYVTGADLA